ncbi:MAG: 3D domain-containing protein [Kiritimatiellia bacterium]|nr:3D domain-containing protein [Kiritimatiellia bacterium]
MDRKTGHRWHYPLLLAALLVGLWGSGCGGRRHLLDSIPANRRPWPEIEQLEVTAYCPCGSCCNWRRNWRGRPVVAAGPDAGKPKLIGMTASGTRARPGTLAADTRLFPFGTIMYIPGYGYGRVEDRGSAIVGAKLDVYFDSHSRALEWGRQTLNVKVWRPAPR